MMNVLENLCKECFYANAALKRNIHEKKGEKMRKKEKKGEKRRKNQKKGEKMKGIETKATCRH